MDKEIISRFEKEVKIDINQLHEECQSHADLYAQYSLLLAATKSMKDAVKEELSILTAETELFYRSKEFNMDEVGLKKITEDTIKALLNSNDDLVKKRTELLQIETDFNTYFAMVASLDQRGKRLDNLTTLWESKYPPFHNGITGMSKEELDKAQDKIRKNIRKKGE
jgi:hypothetical protein